MDDAGIVRGAQGGSNLDRNVECLADRQRCRGEPVPERLPLDVLHCDVVLALARLVERVNRADVRVIEGGRGAGLLLEAQDAIRIARGFNRNHMINFEGGAIPQEYHTAYIIDRVNTTGAVWLGLTVGCAQCHDHKFDPITQKDFYRFYAFFNNVPEN